MNCISLKLGGQLDEQSFNTSNEDEIGLVGRESTMGISGDEGSWNNVDTFARSQRSIQRSMGTGEIQSDPELQSDSRSQIQRSTMDREIEMEQHLSATSQRNSTRTSFVQTDAGRRIGSTFGEDSITDGSGQGRGEDQQTDRGELEGRRNKR